MNPVDGMVFALLALTDVCLIVYLRRRRARVMRVKRMYHTLALSVRRELALGKSGSATVTERRRASIRSLLKSGGGLTRASAQ